MATVFRLPDIGEGLTEAEIVEWHAEIGDEVIADRPLVTVETDKTQAELPAPITGILLHRGAEAGQTLEVGAVLAVVGKEDESWPASDDGHADGGSEDDDDWGLTAAPDERFATGDLPREGDLVIKDEPADGSWGLAEVEGEDESATASDQPLHKRPPALPLVRKLARELGIDLERVVGTGPGGRITRGDVEMIAALSSAKPSTPPAPAPAEPAPTERPPLVGTLVEEAEDLTPAPAMGRVGQPAPITDPPVADRGSPYVADEDELVPLTPTRRAIAEHMTKSWREIPHVTSFGSFDAGRLLEVRRALEARHGARVSLDALLVKAVLPGLSAFPEFNAAFTEDGLIMRSARHIGVAVDADDGLLVAVVRDANRKSIIDLASDVEYLSLGARNRSLRREEMTGQTFTVSNIGAVGGAMGTPIVPHGTCAILSVGRAVETPVVRGGAIAIALIAPISLSYDHRIIDGAMGRRFLSMLVENLEEPALFLA